MLAILGRSWSLCWRSWFALGAYVGGLGLLLELMLAVLGRLGAEVVGLESKWSVLERVRAEKWLKPEREPGSGPAPEREPGSGPAHKLTRPRGPVPIFSIDIYLS